MKAAKKERRQRHAASPERKGPAPWHYAAALFALAILVFEVYGPALSGPFVFDDIYLPISDPAAARMPLRAWLGNRPVLALTYWVNARMTGVATYPSHVTNVLLHLVNTVLVFLFSRAILERAAERTRALMAAAFCAAAFLLHPIQSESVAYLAGRSEVLSSTWMLAALLVLVRFGFGGASWKTAGALMALFGIGLLTKEQVIALPGLLLLTDYFWHTPFSFEGVKRNWRIYAPLAAGAVAGAVWVLMSLRYQTSAGFSTEGIRWYEYFFTECRVLLMYLRMAVLPYGLRLDYDLPVSRTLADHGAAIALAALLALAGAAVYYRKRAPLACYGLLFTLICLAPTSSFVPIRDPIAEHRMYLPLLGMLFMAAEIAVRVRISRTALAGALAAVCIACAFATHARAQVWSNPISLWRDAAAKSPGSSRAHFQYAYALYSAGRCGEAVEAYAAAEKLEKKPEARLYIDWALAYVCMNRLEEAAGMLRKAEAIQPTAHLYSQIGMVEARRQRWAEAMQALEKSEKLDPNFGSTHAYKGGVYYSLGRYREAEAAYRRALELEPESQPAAEGLRLTLQQLGSR